MGRCNVPRSRTAVFRAPFVSCVLALVAALASGGCAQEVDEEPVESAESELFEAKPLGPEPSGSPTRYPIILVHGFGGAPGNPFGFKGVADALRRDGHTVAEAALPSFAPPTVRAPILARQVDALRAKCAETKSCDGAKVNIIAHSQGGLDARHLVSVLGYGDRVASITTVSTPHRGTYLADAAVGLVPGLLDDAVDALGKLWTRIFTDADLAGETDVRAALVALSESASAEFNATHPDDPRVFYQSWAGVSSILGVPNPKDRDACAGRFETYRGRRDHMMLALHAATAIVAHGLEMRPNDGMVSVESARWGEFRGCIPADHADELGGPFDKYSGFDANRFYRNVAFDLQRRGF